MVWSSRVPPDREVVLPSSSYPKVSVVVAPPVISDLTVVGA